MPVDNNDPIFLAQLYRQALALLFDMNSNISDADRVRFAEIALPWEQKVYGTGAYVKYKNDPTTGRAQVYASTRSVPATSPAPDVATNPVNWKRL